MTECTTLFISDYEIEHPRCDWCGFESSISFYDYHTVIWELSELTSLCSTVISDSCFSRRNSEVHSLLESSGCLVILCPTPRTIEIYGRRSSTDRLIPVKDFASTEANGKRITFRGSEPFKSYWEKCADLHTYNAYFDPSIGKPFLFIQGHEDKAVGTHVPIDNGHVVLLPALNEECNSDEIDYFIDAIRELAEELRKGTLDYSLPRWTNEVSLPGESEIVESIRTIEKEIEQLHSLQDEKQARLTEITKNKILLVGQGPPLENQVAKVLEEIGFAVQPGTTNQHDHLIEYNGKVAVVEVKGRTKSGKEEDSRQLEVWVSEYVLEHGEGSSCKGILFLNAYCDTPLSERKGKTIFPDSMLRYSERNEHSLMTTTQLLRLYYHLQQHPGEKDKLIEEMFATVGVFQKFTEPDVIE
jgi:hypothetical protein